MGTSNRIIAILGAVLLLSLCECKKSDEFIDQNEDFDALELELEDGTSDKAGWWWKAPAKVNCVVGGWGGYGGCSKSCGGGTQTRYRGLTQPRNGGAGCPTNSESQSCNTHGCPVDCVVGGWSAYAACSRSCGGGVQSRTRSLTAPQNGGKACPSPTDGQACGADPCPINCVVGAWGEFTTCSKECGMGTQTRTRDLQHARHGGQSCPAASEDRSCNADPCPTPAPTRLPVSLGGKCKAPPVPADAAAVALATADDPDVIQPFAGSSIDVIRNIKVKFETDVYKKVIDFANGIDARAALSATVTVGDAAFRATVFVTYNWPGMKAEIVKLGKWSMNQAAPLITKYIPAAGLFIPEKITALQLDPATSATTTTAAEDRTAEASSWRNAIEAAVASAWSLVKDAAGILGVPGTPELAIKQILDRSKYAIRVDFAAEASIGGLLPFLCNDFTNAIHFNKAVLYFAKQSGLTDPSASDYKIAEGVTVMGEMEIDANTPMKDFLSSAVLKTEMSFIPPDKKKVEQTEWRVKYAGSAAFKFPEEWPLVSTGDVFMTVDYDPNHAKGLRRTVGGGVSSQLKIGEASKGKYPEIFAKFSYVVEDEWLTMGGGIKGCWENPFGIQKFRLCDASVDAVANMTAYRLESIAVKASFAVAGSMAAPLEHILKDPKLSLAGSMKRDTSPGAKPEDWAMEMTATAALQFPEAMPLQDGKLTAKFAYDLKNGLTIGGDLSTLLEIGSGDGEGGGYPTLSGNFQYNFKTSKLSIGGGLKSCWIDPFGVPKFKLCDTSITATGNLTERNLETITVKATFDVKGSVLESLETLLKDPKLQITGSMTREAKSAGAAEGAWQFLLNTTAWLDFPEAIPLDDAKASLWFSYKVANGGSASSDLEVGEDGAPELPHFDDLEVDASASVGGADPKCANGILSAHLCCDKACGKCGGYGCQDLPGGAANCCMGTIHKNAPSCDVSSAPCFLGPPPKPSPVAGASGAAEGASTKVDTWDLPVEDKKDPTKKGYLSLGGDLTTVLKIGKGDGKGGGWPTLMGTFAYGFGTGRFSVSGGLRDCWIEPFGIPNFKLCNTMIDAVANLTSGRLESVGIQATFDARGAVLAPIAKFLNDPMLKVSGTIKRDKSAGAGADDWAFELAATTYMEFPEELPLEGGEISIKLSYSLKAGLTIGGDVKVTYLLNNPVPTTAEGRRMENPTFSTGITYNLLSQNMTLSGGMDNCWSNAFKLDGFNICKVKASVGLMLAKPPIQWCSSLSLSGEIEMSGKVMEPLKTYLGSVTLKLSITMTNKMPAGWDMTAFAGIAMTFPADYPVTAGEFGFTLKYLSGTPPSFAVGLSGSVTVKLGTTPPTFKAEVLYNVVTTSLTFDADMVGCWTDAFDISGLKICDVGLGIGINLAAAAASGGLAAISYFRIQGAIEFGSSNGKPTFIAVLVLVRIDLPAKSALLAVLDGRFSIGDMAVKAMEMAANAGRPLTALRDVAAMFPFYIEDVEIRIAMSSVSIGGRQYNAGMMVKGTLMFFGVKIMVEVSLSFTGVKALAYMSAINIFNMLEVTGSGPDMVAGNADDGAIFSLDLTLAKQALFISGRATALGLFTAACEISISKHGFYFMLTAPLGSGLYKATIIAQTKDWDFLLDLTIEMTFSDDIVKKAKEMAKDTKQKIDKAAMSSSNAVRSVADDVAGSCKAAGVYAETMDLETGIEHSVQRAVRRMQRKAMPAEEFALIEEEALPEMTARELRSLAARAGYYGGGADVDITDDEVDFLGFDARAFGVRFRIGGGSALALDGDNTEALLEVGTGQEWWGPVGKFVKTVVVEPVVTVVVTVVDWVGDAIKAAGQFISGVWNSFKSGLAAIGKALLSAACRLVEAFLSKVVANIVEYALKATAWVVWAGTTFVAKAYEWFTSAFSIQKAHYEGSLKSMLALNFGTIELTVRVGGSDYKLAIVLDVKEWVKMMWEFAKKVWTLLFPSDKGMPEEVDDNSDVFAKRCEISQSVCRNHGQYANTFTDTDNARSSLSESACRRRARDWHAYCGNQASDSTTSNYHAAATKTSSFYPPRCWVNLSKCYTNKISTGGRSVWSKWDLESCFHVSVEYYEACGNRQGEWVDVEFNDGVSSTSKRFGN